MSMQKLYSERQSDGRIVIGISMNIPEEEPFIRSCECMEWDVNRTEMIMEGKYRGQIMSATDYWKAVKTESIRSYFRDSVDETEQDLFCREIGKRQNQKNVFRFLMSIILGGFTAFTIPEDDKERKELKGRLDKNRNLYTNFKNTMSDVDGLKKSVKVNKKASCII